MCRIGVIGTGVVGSAIAILLRQKGYYVTGVCSKTGVTAEDLAAVLGCPAFKYPVEVLKDARVIFLTVPDRELAGMAENLAGAEAVDSEHVFLHMSGALPAEVLSSLKDRGAAIGSIHPLQSFASVAKAIGNLPGAFFAVQGDERAVELAYKIAEDLAGNPFILKKEDKALYHLGACIASNYLVALMHFAVSVYKHIGMTGEQSLQALMPLIRGTLSNIEGLGPVKSLTGPVARGDITTIERHLEASTVLTSEQAELYKILGCYTTLVAMEKGSINTKVGESLLSIFRKEDK